MRQSCAPSSTAETRETATKRFVFVAKNWFRFLGKWRDPERNPQFRPELDSFLKELRDERGYTDQTVSTRESALNLFFEWLGKQGISLKEVSPATLAAYFVQNKARGWKRSTIKAYAQSLRAFFRYASQHHWCMPGLAETIESPRIYSMAGLPEGPSWEQVRRLIASLNTERPSHIRDRAIIMLLAVYGLRIGEVCALTLDDLDWTNEKIRVRRLKNKRIQDFPLTTEVGNAILKYLADSASPMFFPLCFSFATQTASADDARTVLPLPSPFTFEPLVASCRIMAHTVCATPAPHICWTKAFRLRRLVITSVTARHDRHRSTPKVERKKLGQVAGVRSYRV